MRRQPDPTRREVAQQLGLGSGVASDLVGRMRSAGLIDERPAAPVGRGRPTTILCAHAAGPVVLSVDLRHGDWRIAACGIDGVPDILARGRHDGDDPEALVRLVGRRVGPAARRLASRLVAVAVAVPGQVDAGRVVQASMLGWRDIDLLPIGSGTSVPFYAGNDATMAGVAEARVHRPRRRALLHLVVEVGLGGALILDGRWMPSARGLDGEFGHLPFGARKQQCGCGAHGCWGIPFDGRWVARELRQPAPRDPRGWLADLVQRDDLKPRERRLRDDLAASLGTGSAGLVNALDPEVITLGGLAGPLRRSAAAPFAQAFTAGLMAAHRDRPPDVLAAQAGPDATLAGAALTAFDRTLDAALLARWASAHPPMPRTPARA